MEAVVVLALIAVLVLIVLEARKKNQLQQTECDCGCECAFTDIQGTVKPNGRKCISQNVLRNRNGKKQKVGVLVSCQKKGVVRIGYSLCCKTDEYSEKEAYVLASQRMAEATLNPPQSLKKDINRFLVRCGKYYKGATVPTFDGKTVKQ